MFSRWDDLKQLNKDNKKGVTVWVMPFLLCLFRYIQPKKLDYIFFDPVFGICKIAIIWHYDLRVDLG